MECLEYWIVRLLYVCLLFVVSVSYTTRQTDYADFVFVFIIWLPPKHKIAFKCFPLCYKSNPMKYKEWILPFRDI